MKRTTVGLITAAGAALSVATLRVALHKNYSFRNKSPLLLTGTHHLLQ